MRRMSIAVLLVVTLSAVMVAPAAAQPEREYDIRTATLIFDGEQRDFYRVVTGERTLTMQQAEEVCRATGLDDAIGIDRYRENGERLTAVTCTGEASRGVIDVEVTLNGQPFNGEIYLAVASGNDDPGPGGSCDTLPFFALPAGADGRVTVGVTGGQSYCVNVKSGSVMTNEGNIVVVEFVSFGDPVGDDDVVVNFTSSVR